MLPLFADREKPGRELARTPAGTSRAAGSTRAARSTWAARPSGPRQRQRGLLSGSPRCQKLIDEFHTIFGSRSHHPRRGDIRIDRVEVPDLGRVHPWAATAGSARTTTRTTRATARSAGSAPWPARSTTGTTAAGSATGPAGATARSASKPRLSLGNGLVDSGELLGVPDLLHLLKHALGFIRSHLCLGLIRLQNADQLLCLIRLKLGSLGTLQFGEARAENRADPQLPLVQFPHLRERGTAAAAASSRPLGEGARCESYRGEHRHSHTT